jgi:N-acetylglucosaminyldiphosphoundecaprenol N-acetyl-beta-D-mannosaminyltransferase
MAVSVPRVGVSDLPRDLSPAFPHRVNIEGIAVDAFPDLNALFARLFHEVRHSEAQPRIFAYLNVHVANMAYQNPALKEFLQNANVVYCDGAGIAKAAKFLGQRIPTRFTAADWIFDLWDRMATENLTGYFLGGEPGVAIEALARYATRPNTLNLPYPICGLHHGYILNHPELEQKVIDDINAQAPDILFVGFGTPLQEQWIARNRHRLHVKVIYPIGAVLDYHTGKLARCPAWMGEAGLEWLFRLLTEPRRLFARYVIGNPWFYSRILKQSLRR